MEGVTLQLFEQGKSTYVENAAYAEWKGDEWVMHDGVIYDVTGGEGQAQASRHTIRFATQSLPVDQGPREIVNSQKKPEAMTIRELKDQIKILASQYVDTSKLEKEVYERITIPFASFVFALVGMPPAEPFRLHPRLRGEPGRHFHLLYADGINDRGGPEQRHASLARDLDAEHRLFPGGPVLYPAGDSAGRFPDELI